MDQVAIDIEEIASAGEGSDDMGVPNFVEECGHVQIMLRPKRGRVFDGIRARMGPVGPSVQTSSGFALRGIAVE
jgi:hypothetical protein